jgi:hypothetical protein
MTSNKNKSIMLELGYLIKKTTVKTINIFNQYEMN